MESIKPEPYRYINLVLFLLTAVIDCFPPQAFTAIAPQTKQLYDVSEVVINLNSMMYPLMTIILSFPVNYILDIYGVKIGTLLCQYFMIIGLLMRLLINYSFYFFLAGTWVTALGFLFLFNSPNKFCVLWFPVKQIPLINSACMFCLFASPAISLFISALFLPSDSNKNDYFNFFLWQSIVLIIIHLTSTVFFRGAPKTIQNHVSKIERQKPFQAIKKLGKNKNYTILFLSLTFIYGCVCIFFVTISWQLKIYKFDSLDTGYVIIIANIIGLFGCMISGIYLKNHKIYRLFSIITAFGGVVALGVVFLGMELQSKILLYVGGGLFGIFCFPFLTTMSDFSAESAFPVGQAMSAGNLLFGGQALGFIGGILLSFLFDGETLFLTRLGSGIQFLMMLAGALILIPVREDLRRTNYQNSKNGTQRQNLLSQYKMIEK